nr:hypothetical protein [Oedogonium sp. 1_circle_61917]
MEGIIDFILVLLLFLFLLFLSYDFFVISQQESSLINSFCFLSIKRVRATPLKSSVTISLLQKQIIAGLLFSDGHLRNPNKKRRNTGNYRLEFTFKSDVFNFCEWVKFDLLGTISTSGPLTPYPKNNPTQYWFATRNNIFFTELYSIWYFKTEKGIIKRIPCNNYLEEFFSEVSLAHAIMGDGYWLTQGKTVYLCTESFSHDDVMRFIKFLEHKFKLKATPSKRVNNYRIRFKGTSENLLKLRKLVKPYMHPSMLYKLGINIYDPTIKKKN